MVKRTSRHVNNGPKKGKTQPTRRLRSKEEVKSESKPTLFNFENINGLLYRDDAIEVTSASDYKNLYSSMNDAELPPKYRICKSTTVEVKEELLPRKSKHYENVLPDDLYEPFHKKMRKEERTMVNSDRLRILSEVDNLQSSIKILDQYDWARYLPGITYIRDIRDYDELDEKRKLTIAEIGSILEKHDDWKRRQDKLNSDIRRFDTLQDEDTESDEYTAPIETLKRRRVRERRESFGPIIKLRLNNGYSLIIDPVLAPKIVRTEYDPKNSTKDEINKGGLVLGTAIENGTLASNRERIKPIKLENIPDKSKLNLSYDENKRIAFGKAIPSLDDAFVDFELFPSWRKKADTWIPGRKKLRKSLDEFRGN